ncbi:hypothetical protein K438DRAFT_1783277 [Mycena galopus ATCC 62051]|nr:hypothetical protein K438DRAFT_1783277 [Mycena galopus ATCC 62051]
MSCLRTSPIQRYRYSRTGNSGKKAAKDEISKSETSDIPACKPTKKKPGPRPKPTTTAKARKKTPGPTSKTRDLDIDSDSDVEEVKKPKAKRQPVCFVPFLVLIRGCDRDHVRDYSAACKPTLVYELSSAGQKAAPINLHISKDWDGLIKSKKDLSIMSILTALPDNECLEWSHINEVTVIGDARRHDVF